MKYTRILSVLRIRIRDPGSGIGCLFDPWIRDPGSGIRDGRKSASGSGIRDEQPGSYFLELRNHFFAFLGVKILKFFDEDPGWRQFGSGIRKLYNNYILQFAHRCSLVDPNLEPGRV